MSFEENISTIIQEELKGELIERVVQEQLEKCVRNAVDELFGNWGSCKKIIEKKIEEVMIPQLEKYNYGAHILKLDEVLTQVLKQTTLDNNKVLSNFEEFITAERIKEVALSDIFNKYCDVVAENVDTTNLKVNFEDGVSYEPVTVNMEVDISEREYSKYTTCNIYLSCDEDDSLNISFQIMKERTRTCYWISSDMSIDLASLRYVNEFQLYIMNLKQSVANIYLDTRGESETVIPTEEPEPTFN